MLSVTFWLPTELDLKCYSYKKQKRHCIRREEA